MAITVCAFNVNNLFVRYKFGKKFPGDMGEKSLVGGDWGYLPIYQKGMFELFSKEQRELAAKVIRRGTAKKYPDVLCLVEVESMLALREFNEQHLGGYYDEAMLVDSRDFRLIDVAILSKRPITAVRSHVDDQDNKGYVFSRDCLEVEVATNDSGSKSVRLYINHLKSKMAKNDAEAKAAAAKRKRQAERVVQIVKERHAGGAFKNDRFVVLGDMNDSPGSPPIAALTDAGLEDMLARHASPDDRWTHWYKSENQVSQLDHVLLSPALSKETDGQLPVLERRGIGHRQKVAANIKAFHEDGTEAAFQFPRFPGVDHTQAASDHAAIFFEVASGGGGRG